MHAPLIAALAREFKRSAESTRDALPAGKHAIDTTVTLHVTGDVTVAETSFYRPTTSIPLKAALALFIRYSGVTGPAAMQALVRAMSEAVTTPEAALHELADLEAAEAQVLRSLEALPLEKRRGAVKVDCVVVEVKSVKKAKAA